MKSMAEFDGKPDAERKVENHQMSLPSRQRRVKGRKIVTKSITKLEIERYWKNKHMEEDDHLFSAIKAAARIRARNLTEEVYKRFEESLDDTNMDEYSEESSIGIKDWWTKSKYAYLNQPAIGTLDKKKRASSYVPNSCFYKIPVSSPGHYVAYPYLGVF
ncbi:hypothetical protein QQ045_012108 [Rhodiola kirilowii]